MNLVSLIKNKAFEPDKKNKRVINGNQEVSLD